MWNGTHLDILVIVVFTVIGISGRVWMRFWHVRSWFDRMGDVWNMRWPICWLRYVVVGHLGLNTQ